MAQETLVEAQIRELVHKAIGEASLCWSKPLEAGVFDSTKATKIGEKLCQDIAGVLATKGELHDDGQAVS